MKVGDKVYCYYGYDMGYDPYLIEEGKYYTIEEVDTSYVKIKGITFRIESDEDVNPYLEWFKAYFYTEKQLRKLKLDKLK